MAEKKYNFYNFYFNKIFFKLTLLFNFNVIIVFFFKKLKLKFNIVNNTFCFNKIIFINFFFIKKLYYIYKSNYTMLNIIVF